MNSNNNLNLTDNKQKYKNMFFVIKLFSLLFMLMPIYQSIFDAAKFYIYELLSMFTSLAFILLLLFFWLFLDKRRYKSPIYMALEVCSFFILCIVSVYLSGGYASYFKSLFIFIIVTYTIEFGMVPGLIIAGASSISLFVIDLVSLPQITINKYLEGDIALSVMFAIIAWVIGFYVNSETNRAKKLEQAVNMDGLTGLYNHRYFHEVIKSACTYKEGKKTIVSLLMFDLDFFKSYNDVFGHQKGDLLLMLIAELLKKHFGKDSLVFRYGGDEFCVIFLDRGIELAYNAAEAFRKEVLKLEYIEKRLLRERISVSVGVSQLYPENDDYLSLIERADKALYKAKYLGKNRVEMYSSIFDRFTDLEPEPSATTRSIKQIITTINSRDSYTYNHTDRVVHFCELFADHLGLDSQDTKKLIYSAYVHDLGKIHIPKEVLIKEGPLTAEEWQLLRQHPYHSAQIAREFNDMDEIADIILQHHERYDGNGYPNGFKGTQISYFARILTIIDSFDAMTSKRPYNYKRSKSYEEAIEDFKQNKGKQFDPDLTDKFIQVLELLFNSTKFELEEKVS